MTDSQRRDVEYIEQWNGENLEGNGLKRILREAGVPKKFLGASEADFGQQKISKHFAAVLGGASAYIHGDAGRGKTHLAVTLLRHAVVSNPARVIFDGSYTRYSMPPTPVFGVVPDILLNVRETTKKRGSEQAIIDSYVGPHLVVLDDLGAEQTTEWTIQTIFMIIDGRYRRCKQTIVTSNLSIAALSRKVGDRVASRIAEMCRGNIIELKGKDRRTS